MQQFARTTTAVLVLCLLLPACTLDSGDEHTQGPAADAPMLLTPDMGYNRVMAVVNFAPRYGGPGPESEGVVYFDAETFYREWAAWKALGLTDYTYRLITYGGDGNCTVKLDVEAAGNSAIATLRYSYNLPSYTYNTGNIKWPGDTVDQLFENLEGLNQAYLESAQNWEAGKKGKYGIEISYDPQYHYPVSIVNLYQAEYQPHCYETWWYLDNGFEVEYPFCTECEVKAAQGDRNYRWFPTYNGCEITSFQPMD